MTEPTPRTETWPSDLSDDELSSIRAWMAGDDSVSLSSLFDDAAAYPDVARALRSAIEAQARTEALDVGALDAALEEAVSILTNRGGYGWTDALHVVQKARAILAAKETP